MFSQESWDMGEERRKLHDSGCRYLSSAHSNILINIQTGGRYVEVRVRAVLVSLNQEISTGSMSL